MGRPVRATAAWALLVVLVAVVALWWQPWRGGDEASAVDPDPDPGASSPATADQEGAPAVQREAVDGGLPEPAPEEAPERPVAMVEGRVLARESRRPIRAGTVALAYVDPVAEGTTLDALLAMEPEERAWLESFEEVTLQPDGTFALSLPAGVILRRALLNPILAGSDLMGGFLETEQDLGDQLLGAEGATVELLVTEGFVIQGQVLDARTLLPVQGARVAAVWWNLEDSLDGDRTDAAGRFRIGGLRPEVVARAAFLELKVEAAGYVPLRERILLQDPGDGMEGVTLSLVPGPSWTGTVVDAAGAPVAGAEVTACQVSGPDPLGADLAWLCTARTDAEGRFDLGALGTVQDAVLMARQGPRPATLVPLSGPAPPPELRVPLPETTWLSLEVQSAPAFDPASLSVVAGAVGGAAPAWTLQNGLVRDGRWGVWLRRGQAVTLWASARGAATDRTVALFSGGVQVLPEQAQQTVQVPLHAATAPPPRGEVTWTLREGGSRRVLAHTPVSLSEAHRPTLSRHESGAAGELHLELPPGRHFLVVRSPGYAPRFLQVDLDWPGPWSGDLLLWSGP